VTTPILIGSAADARGTVQVRRTATKFRNMHRTTSCLIDLSFKLGHLVQLFFIWIALKDLAGAVPDLDPSWIITSIVDGLAYAMLLFLIASGFSIIFGLMGILNFAHGALFMIGAYIAVAVFSYSGNYVAALVGASLVGLILGVAIQYLTLRRVHGNPIAQIMLTLGYLLIFSRIVVLIWKELPRVFYPAGLTGSTTVLSAQVSVYRVFLILFGLIVAGSTYLILTKTRVGTIVRAGTEDAGMVETFGINVKLAFTLTFGFGAALAALGGAAVVPWLGATPEMGTTWLFTSLVVTVVGGLGSFKGSFYGSLLIGLLHGFSEYFFPSLTFVIDFLVMTAVLLVRPEGLFGERK
jgi:branched-chain amino acid transport system permease protein